MHGFEVCWVPGMDHAGIATQMVVENELAKSNKTKHDLGRIIIAIDATKVACLQSEIKPNVGELTKLAAE